MYELPKESYLIELVGQQINLISVGPYVAQITFEKGVVIQSLHKLEGVICGVRSLWFDGEWITTKDIINVPMKEVLSVSNESELILKIQLSGNIELLIHTEISQYESINITRSEGSLEVI